MKCFFPLRDRSKINFILTKRTNSRAASALGIRVFSTTSAVANSIPGLRRKKAGKVKSRLPGQKEPAKTGDCSEKSLNMVYCESMLEKKRPEKIKPALELDKAVTEILVANGRSVEPFIKVFQYSGENVTKSSLGTLVGIFDIAERSEESAYIVNFLASVAKKEYFNNPRRGAIESFEAALHKINLALAELVKHGNIAWLGKLHGALCVLEKNNLHFSVTGDAQILLLRNGNFSEISAGLASEESSLHPIKTFVEVSSGRMMLADKILLTSPELFTLFSLEDLSKNALRMDDERFAQFLRTALINELDMAGTFIIDVQEGQPPVRAPHRPEVPAEETVHNVFSQQAFAPPAKMQDAVPQEQEYH